MKPICVFSLTESIEASCERRWQRVKKPDKTKQRRYEFALLCRSGVSLEEGIPIIQKHMPTKRYRTGYG